MKRKLLLAVDKYRFEEPVQQNKFLGTIYAINTETGEVQTRTFRTLHNGKTNKFDVLANFMTDLVPPSEMPVEDANVDN